MTQNKFILLISLLIILGAAAGCFSVQEGPAENSMSPSPVEKIAPGERNIYDRVVIGARQEVVKGVQYDASYKNIDYPGGDVDPSIGACTDVVVRAFRNGGIDLQKLIHEDMQAHFELYPQKWSLSGPDPNIDHRRVPNQMKFFQRHGQALPLSVNGDNLSAWMHGDIVYWKFLNGLQHCGIISDRKNSRGIPLVIHNAGTAREEDSLTRWEIIGHYRYPLGN
ncbi:MAG: DUF1287 domain-containing protein [Clostridiales bacterium]|nr:DUF1287 domain-containing protein [Clostridiales bacterium]MCF8023476.1 DUF1287 domain-containing protein [Clostridiales bacterium]